MKCFICEKEVVYLDNMPNNPDNAGTISVHFGYGSRYDGTGMGYFENSDEPRVDRLASCDIISGVLCDDCFEKKQHLLDGYEVIKHTTSDWNKIV